jgi:hypothetical protein
MAAANREPPFAISDFPLRGTVNWIVRAVDIGTDKPRWLVLEIKRRNGAFHAFSPFDPLVPIQPFEVPIDRRHGRQRTQPGHIAFAANLFGTARNTGFLQCQVSILDVVFDDQPDFQTQSTAATSSRVSRRQQ